MLQHSYALEVDEARLANVGKVTISRAFNPVPMNLTIARLALPNLEMDICRVLTRLGYNFRSRLSGVIVTDRELDPQDVRDIEGYSEQYGVPVTLRYRRLD